MDGNNQPDSGCCCQSLIRENDNIKKNKPILIAGIIFYIILAFLDTFYLKNLSFFSYIAIVVFLCLMVFNGCYFFFSMYFIFSTLLLVTNIIPTFGVPLQTGFKSNNAIGAFIIHFIAFVFYFVYFYFGFKTYKEMKYIFQTIVGNSPQLSSHLVGEDRAAYNNYNGNNTTGDALSIYKCSHTNTEMQLNFFKYNLNYKNVDEEKEILTNKLIKSSLLKDAIKKFSFNKTKNKLYNYFDEIILFILNKPENKFKRIEDYCMIGYINALRNSTLFNIINNQTQIYKDSLFYINFIFDNSNNTYESKKIVLYEYYNTLGFLYNKFIEKKNETIQLYQKFINCKFISKEDKDELEFYYKSLSN